MNKKRLKAAATFYKIKAGHLHHFYERNDFKDLHFVIETGNDECFVDYRFGDNPEVDMSFRDATNKFIQSLTEAMKIAQFHFESKLNTDE